MLSIRHWPPRELRATLVHRSRGGSTRRSWSMAFLLMKRRKFWGFIRVRHGPPTYNSKAHLFSDYDPRRERQYRVSMPRDPYNLSRSSVGSSSWSITPTNVTFGLVSNDLAEPVSSCFTVGTSCMAARFSSLSNCGNRQLRQMLSGCVLTDARRRRYFQLFQMEVKLFVCRFPIDRQYTSLGLTSPSSFTTHTCQGR